MTGIDDSPAAVQEFKDRSAARPHLTVPRMGRYEPTPLFTNHRKM